MLDAHETVQLRQFLQSPAVEALATTAGCLALTVCVAAALKAGRTVVASLDGKEEEKP